LDVLDNHLAGKTYLVNEEFTIADIAWFPWVRCLETGYNAAEHLGLSDYKNVSAWLALCLSRESAQRGLKVNSADLPEYHSTL
jgi:GST-like protein